MRIHITLGIFGDTRYHMKFAWDGSGWSDSHYVQGLDFSLCFFFPQIKKGLFVGLIHSGKSYVIVAIDLEWWLFHIIPDTVKKTNKS